MAQPGFWTRHYGQAVTAGELCSSIGAPSLGPDARAPCRFWTQADLRRVRSVVHYEALRPVFAKLRAGLPVTVAAFGSSITSSYGGCYHTDVEALSARLGGALPPNFQGNKQRKECASNGANRFGFVAHLMAALNKTWPHAGHTLVNVGVGAATLASFAHHTCLDELAGVDVQEHTQADGNTEHKSGRV